MGLITLRITDDEERMLEEMAGPTYSPGGYRLGMGRTVGRAIRLLYQVHQAQAELVAEMERQAVLDAALDTPRLSQQPAHISSYADVLEVYKQARPSASRIAEAQRWLADHTGRR